MEVAALIISALALLVSWGVGVRQGKASDRLVKIEEWRHEKEKAEAEVAEDRQRQAEEATLKADLAVRFAFRDSARSHARRIVLNNGPHEASGVVFDVWGDTDEGPSRARVVGDESPMSRDVLQPGESLHIDLGITGGRPYIEDHRYKLT